MEPAIATVVAAGPAHVAAIVAIERGLPGRSIVALTHGLAVEEALTRGHGVAVAIEGDTVAGWVWWTVEDARGGERTGQLSRVAIAPAHRLRGHGRTLVAHALAAMRADGARSVRLAIDADDANARAFFEHLGFAPAAVTMERPL